MKAAAHKQRSIRGGQEARLWKVSRVLGTGYYEMTHVLATVLYI